MGPHILILSDLLDLLYDLESPMGGIGKGVIWQGDLEHNKLYCPIAF